MHNIKHLHEDVAHFDCSLNEISAFPFENHLKTIKKLVKTSHNPLVQVAKRMAEKEHAQKNTKQKQTRQQLVSGKQRDSCFLLQDGSVAFVTEKKKQMANWFAVSSHITKPPTYLKSLASLNSWTLLLLAVPAAQLQQRQDLKTKAVCLPHCGGYAIFPLLHDVE